MMMGRRMKWPRSGPRLACRMLVDVLLSRVKMGTGANREKQEKREKADNSGRKSCEKIGLLNWKINLEK